MTRSRATAAPAVPLTSPSARASTHHADRDVEEGAPTGHRPRAPLLEGVHPGAVDVLERGGFAVTAHPGALSRQELLQAVRGVQLLGIRSSTRLDRRVLEAATGLRDVGAFCIGTDRIDLRAATEAGVVVFDAPHANGRSVAELALAEITALTRRRPVRNAAAHAGVRDKSAAGSHEVRGRCLGVVGYGAIGGQLSVLAEALGMSVLFHDVADRAPLGRARRCADLQELLARADAVSLHVDGRAANTALIGEAELAAMKTGSVLLNLSRGAVVDLRALHRHLLSGHLAGAALDVFPDEPHAVGEAFTSPLQGVDNVLLTPHVGGSTQEAQREIGLFVADRLVRCVRTGTTSSSVNLPDLHPPATAGTTRVQLLHRAHPDVPDQADAALRGAGVPVPARAHARGTDTGSLLLDVDPAHREAAACALRTLPAALRVDARASPARAAWGHPGPADQPDPIPEDPVSAVVGMLEEHWPAHRDSLHRGARDRDDMVAHLREVPGPTVFPTSANFVLVKLPAGWGGARVRDHLIAELGVHVRECGNELGLSSDFARLVVRPAGDVDRLLAGLHDVAERTHRPA
ncbi:phosphoglycerate dehydrogenase [Kineococcus auxinigenes]|uniref:phosphoglycerate dehydrogenase n=1 Tax=unclassified Kineococcus TaxID=2621656 RepID=UPI003D7DBAF8